VGNTSSVVSTDPTGMNIFPSYVYKALKASAPQQKTFQLWCESKFYAEKGVKPQFIRCFPTDKRRLAEKGPFRDWVQADFRVNESDQPMLYPAKVILFFENTTGQKKVLVHPCNDRSEQQKARGSRNGIGMLVSSWPMELQKNGDPELYVLPINQIKK